MATLPSVLGEEAAVGPKLKFSPLQHNVRLETERGRDFRLRKDVKPT
jgi:hypothetical protein